MPPASDAPISSSGRLVKWLLAVTLPLYLVDQATKWLVTRNISDPVTVIPGWFELVSVTNTGAAWGMFANGNRGFEILSALAVVVLAVLYRQKAFDQPLAQAGFFLLLSGIFGNLTDRFGRGHVVDFLSFDLHVPGAHPWPSFNVADSCICLAVAAFIFGSWQDLRRPDPRS